MTSRSVRRRHPRGWRFTENGTTTTLLPFREQTLLRHAVETAFASVCRPIVVVIGAHSDLVRLELQSLPVLVAHNPRWQGGIGSSLRVGITNLRAFDDIEGAVITLSDEPLVTATALNRLVEAHCASGKHIVAPEYADSYGVPVFIGEQLFDEIATVQGDQGAKSVIARHLEAMTTVPLVEAAFDIDTLKDYERLTGSHRQ